MCNTIETMQALSRLSELNEDLYKLLTSCTRSLHHFKNMRKFNYSIFKKLNN